MTFNIAALKIDHFGRFDLKRFVKGAGYALIFLHPIDSYLLKVNFVIGISFFRIAYLLFLLSFIAHLTRKLEIKNYFTLYLTMLLYLIAMVWAILFSTKLSEFSAYYLNEIMGLILIFVFVNIYEREDIPILLNSFIFSALFPFLISIYVYYEYFFNLRLIDTLPLSDTIPFFKTYTFDTIKFRAGFFPRIGLPYSISPALAISMSLMIVIQFFRLKNREVNKTWGVLVLVVLVFLMLGTLTRTTILSLVITIIIYWFYEHRRFRLGFSISRRLLLLISVLIILTILFSQTVFYEKIIGRVTSNTIKEDRHFLLILEGINILVTNLRTLLFGIGDGNLYQFQGKYTFLPPHSLLNSYLTLLVHRGVIGFIFTISIYIYLAITLVRAINSRVKNSITFLFALINLSIAFIFYELRFVMSVWIFMAIAFILITKKKKFDLSNNSCL